MFEMFISVYLISQVNVIYVYKYISKGRRTTYPTLLYPASPLSILCPGTDTAGAATFVFHDALFYFCDACELRPYYTYK